MTIPSIEHSDFKSARKTLFRFSVAILIISALGLDQLGVDLLGLKGDNKIDLQAVAKISFFLLLYLAAVFFLRTNQYFREPLRELIDLRTKFVKATTALVEAEQKLEASPANPDFKADQKERQTGRDIARQTYRDKRNDFLIDLCAEALLAMIAFMAASIILKQKAGITIFNSSF